MVQKQQLSQPKGKASEVKDPSFEDWLLVELTRWFNESFFTWINTIPCKVCGKEDGKASGSMVENDVRVEVWNRIDNFHNINQLIDCNQSIIQ